MKSTWRFITAAVLLAATGVLLQARSSHELIPARTPLALFPHNLAGWTSRDLTMDKDTLAVLGPGDFLLRDFSDGSGKTPFVNLFIAYFPSQRAGDTIHSPKNCLPGSGWFPLRADRITVKAPGHAPFPANRYLIARGDERQLVLYWYWAHDRAVASEYRAKFYLVADSIRMHRTDGSLVRLSTPLIPGEDMDSAQERLLAFGANVIPLLNTYVPR